MAVLDGKKLEQMILQRRNINDFLMEIGCPITVFNGTVGLHEYELINGVDSVECSPFVNLPDQLFVSEKDGHFVISSFKVEKSIWLQVWTSNANRMPHNVMMVGRGEFLFVNKLKKINVKIIKAGLNIVQYKRPDVRLDIQDKPV